MLALFEYVCGGILNTGSLKSESASLSSESHSICGVSGRTGLSHCKCPVESCLRSPEGKRIAAHTETKRT